MKHLFGSSLQTLACLGFAAISGELNFQPSFHFGAGVVAVKGCLLAEG
jgi:hypothetical protein